MAIFNFNPDKEKQAGALRLVKPLLYRDAAHLFPRITTAVGGNVKVTGCPGQTCPDVIAVPADEDPPAQHMKRFFDISASLMALLLLAPLSLIVLVMLRLESPAPILRRSHRVGRNGRMVKVWEFRTAIADPEAMETVGGCQGEQLTRLGAVLRRTGIAQWPLLVNVLRGDFSLVGPRVELPRYVGCYPGDIRKRLLSIKPGLFDLATIQFDEEPQLLANLTGDDLEQAYVEKVLPRRLEYAQMYLDQSNFWLDLRILFLSITKVLHR